MFIIALLVIFLLNNRPILASDRNIFGLHLTQPSDLEIAKNVINSSGGDWGWATTVIRLDQLDHNTWQDYFDNCRKYHIIPIIRLATLSENGHWKKPEISDIDTFASFLNSLNWPTEQQHVILFNEPNHASEWGGSVDAKSFADISIYAAKKFKTVNPDFFILNGALDLAAPDHLPDIEAAATFYREIYLYQPEYFTLFDGLASHSYPNHGYVGTPVDTGQHSIHGYLWELSYLRSLGVSQTYPVFITETGWPHREGETKNNQFYLVNTSAQFLNEALDIWSQDPQVVAVTPFIFNYPHAPFDHFSWLDVNERIYPQYQQVIDQPKKKNTVTQISKYEVVENKLPFLLFTGHEYLGKITLKNAGQSIWGETQFCLTPQTTVNVTLDAICTNNQFVYPGQSEEFSYKIIIKDISDYKDKTFISWQDLPQMEITPFAGSGTIFSPKLTLKQRAVQFFQDLFI